MSLFANLPFASLGVAFVLCLLISSLGFRRVDWFISLGYGFSIAGQAVLFLIVYRDTNSVWISSRRCCCSPMACGLGSI